MFQKCYSDEKQVTFLYALAKTLARARCPFARVLDLCPDSL